MSDLEYLLEARNDEELLARAWEWTKPRLRKLRTGGLTEQEGYLLLFLWGGKKEVTAESRRRKRNVMALSAGNSKSLHWAADCFSKDTKTIRRWCEKGHFPGAFKTAGGHWRIPFSAVQEVYERRPPWKYPQGFGRRPKTLFGTKAWKQFKKDFLRPLFEGIERSCETEAALRDDSQKQFSTTPTPPSEEAIEGLRRMVNGAAAKYGGLRFFARRLHLEDPCRRVTAKLLADRLNIHRSTLYRRFPKEEEVKSAIKAATTPLRPSEEPDAQDCPLGVDALAASIRNEFHGLAADAVPEFGGSPFFNASGR